MSQQHIATPAAGLPVIDLSAASGTPEQRAAFQAELNRAATEVGFFHLTGHGVTERETAELTEAMHAFFALPEAERLAISNLNSPHFRGYTRTGTERTQGRSDWRDQIDIGAELPEHRPAPASRTTGGWRGPTSGPRGCPSCARPRCTGSSG